MDNLLTNRCKKGDKMKSKILSILLSITILTSSVSPILQTSYADTKENSAQFEISEQHQNYKNDDISNEETLKSWHSYLVKKFVKNCARGLRKGIRSKYVKRMVSKYLDDAATATLFNYAGAIADKLDYLVEMDLLYSETIQRQLVNMLTELEVAEGTAYAVADAIVAVIRFFTV